MQKGSCLCQSVTFEVDGDIPHPVACHCTMCRKISGHFWAATGFKREKLKLTGEENLTWFQSSENVRRGFCKNCGSALFFDATDTPWIRLRWGHLIHRLRRCLAATSISPTRATTTTSPMACPNTRDRHDRNTLLQSNSTVVFGGLAVRFALN